ncbi:MAG: chromosome partitioning protein ParB, partial [Sphingomonas sp.]
FDAQRRKLLAVLDYDPDSPTIARGGGTLTGLLAKLSTLDDATVMDILAVVMGETLDARSDLVDALGMQLGIDMAEVWQADAALLDGIRDREVIDAMLAEVAGKEIADANIKETGKVKGQIIRDCLDGANGRAKVEGWVPRWLHFPATGYTTRGGVASVARTASAAEAMSPVVAAEQETESDVAPMVQAA